MPKNNEKKDWSEMTDEEKKAEDERLSLEQGESKLTGWEEKFKERQELIKEAAESTRPQETKIETTDERETELTKQREELGGVYESKTQKTSEVGEEEAERLIKDAEGELERLINEKNQSGKELSQVEIYRLTKKFYLDKLGYEEKRKGILGRKARIWDKKEKNYIPDDQSKKPIEFKLMRSPKGETPILKFLRESFEVSVRNSLAKDSLEKDVTGKVEEKRDFKEGVIKDLAEAWDEQEKAGKEAIKKREEIEKEAERLMQEKREELYGKSISDPEVYYDVTRNFYFKKLGYEPKLKGILGGKARIWDLKEGKYVTDENGKPLEFKTKFSPKGETPLLKFLEEKYKNEFIIKDLEKKYQEKTEELSEESPAEAEVSEKEKEYQEWLKSVGAAEALKLAKAFEVYKTGKIKTQENIQKAAREKAESEKRPLTQTEFFSRYLTANDLDEKDITPAKLQELQQGWKVYRKEMRIKSSKTQMPEGKASGKTAERKEGAKGETKEKQISPLIREKLIKFFRDLIIESDESDKGIKKTLDDLTAGKIDSAEKEISRMLANSKRNLKRIEEEGKNPRLVKKYENHIKRLEGFLEEIRSPAITEETGMTEDQLAEIIEAAINKGNARKEKEGTETK